MSGLTRNVETKASYDAILMNHVRSGRKQH